MAKKPFLASYRSRRAAAVGMTLIEVLVALVIFALGMLGAGGLMLASLRSGQFSRNASMATSLARDYSDIMQMIPPTVIATAGGATNTFTIDTASPPALPAQRCKTGDCTPTEMINMAVWDWSRRVISSLPGGRAVICKDTEPRETSGAAAGLYRWECNDTGDLMVVKFGWEAKTGPSGTGDDTLTATDANSNVRPKMVITLFGNQQEIDGI